VVKKGKGRMTKSTAFDALSNLAPLLRVRPELQEICRDLSQEWTLAELAARASTSRATLVRSFGRIANVAPLAFLTELRLAFARRRLATTGDPIARIAADVGYQGEAALSRAFHRRFGVRPGKFRIDARSRGSQSHATLDQSAQANRNTNA
jgi:AraC-like DNA-binding protein